MIELFSKNEVANLLNKVFLTHTVRNFGNYDAVAAVFALFDIGNGANSDRTFTSGVSLFHWSAAIDLGTSWKIWAFDIFHQALEGDVWIINLSDGSIYQLTKIVWWDIGSHTDSDTHLAV